MFRFHSSSRLIPLALASVLAAGCGKLPTQPAVDQATTLGVQEMRAGGASTTRLQQPPPGDNPLSSSSSARIFGHHGGSVTAGIFTVVLPPGAFSGFATVTVRQMDPAQPVAILEITPASKNGFKQPVTLIARLSGMEVGNMMQVGMSELDPSTGEWLAMAGAQPNASTMSVSTPLEHFSTYRVELPTTAPPAGGSPGAGGTLPPGKQSTIQE
jgi:hypothetical protein